MGEVTLLSISLSALLYELSEVKVFVRHHALSMERYFEVAYLWRNVKCTNTEFTLEAFQGEYA